MNGEDEGAEEDADAAAGLDLSLGKKKKKRKPKARTDEEFGALVEDTEAAPDGEKENDDDGLPGQPKLPWDGTDRDYTYQELLGRSSRLLVHSLHVYCPQIIERPMLNWVTTCMQIVCLASCGRTTQSSQEKSAGPS